MTCWFQAHLLVRALEKIVFVNSECVYDLGSPLLLFLLEMLPLAHVLNTLLPASGAALRAGAQKELSGGGPSEGILGL